MMNIKILVVLDKELSNYEEDIELFFNNENSLLEFTTLDDSQLEEKLLNSDIQIILIEKNIKNFTEELYQKMNKQYLFIYFNIGIQKKKDRDKYKINELSPVEFKELKQLNRLKKIYQYTEVNSFTFLEKLKSNLKGKVEEVKDRKESQSTYLEAIKIKKYFSITDMEIEDLKEKKEIYFVGENGDGKTVLLQAIILAFKYNEYSDLAKLYIGEEQEKNGIEIYTKDTQNSKYYIEHKNLKNIFAYGINRNKINNKESEKSLGYSAIFDTSSITRTTYLREPEILLLDKSDIIKKFIPKIEDLMANKLKILITDKVEFQEVNGDTIKFDMLSEGYKTTLIWLSDLLSRLIENQPKVMELKEFRAIVLIDEVDLYLHPKWKYDFMNKLRKIFPKIQFIMTTHSLVTVLGASEDAVFYKVYKEGKNTKITSQIDDISYYTSDILMTSPLFNLETIKSRQFIEREKVGRGEGVSSDDYIYHRIHKKIKKRLNKTPSATDEDVDSWLDDAFDEEFGEE